MKIIINKEITALKSQCDQLKKELDDFYEKFTVYNSTLAMKEINNVKCVYLKKYNGNRVDSMSLIMQYSVAYDRFGDESNELYRLKKKIEGMKRNVDCVLRDYGDSLYRLINNYNEIKKEVGIELIKKDNEIVKQQFIETHNELRNFINSYEWHF